jgi:hypothetical protein
MEFLIAAGIAALGYQLSLTSSTPSETRKPEVPKPQEIITVKDARNDEKARAAQAFQDSEDPYRTNVIRHNPNTQPFFRSARSQNTSDQVKSRLFDLFTGTLDIDSSQTGTYMKKKETGPRFQPLPQPVSSSGSSGNPVCWERRMPTPSMLQNNVRPTPQTQVGPGMCVGPDVAAADGFHYTTCRVMPKNVGEYKLNQLEARINIGGAQNAMRSADPMVAQNRPPRVWDINRRPPEATKATVNARTSRPIDMGLRCVDDRLPGEEYFGHPAQNAHPAPADSSESTRLRSDAHNGFPTTNVTGARHGVGGFTHATYDTARMERQQREQAGFEGMLTGDHRRGTAPRTHALPPTHREITSNRSEHFMGTATHFIPSTDTRPLDAARTTLRQLTAGPNDVGGAAPVHTAPMVQCTYQQLGKPAKRYDTTTKSAGYVPGPQRTNEYRRANLGDDDPWQAAGICKGKFVALRQRAHDNRVLGHAGASSMYWNMAPPGASAQNSNKLPVVNPRQDFGLAQEVLKTNELAISIV